jgi:hypothetical protein
VAGAPNYGAEEKTGHSGRDDRKEKRKRKEKKTRGVSAKEPTLRKKREGWGTLKFIRCAAQPESKSTARNGCAT